ncbi:MAG: DnaB-like helicase C-terminal domain-containing protein [Candidatus Phytoplasma sp. TWB_XP]
MQKCLKIFLKKHNILIFSLEMTSEELVKRLISCESQISIKKTEQRNNTNMDIVL